MSNHPHHHNHYHGHQINHHHHHLHHHVCQKLVATLQRALQHSNLWIANVVESTIRNMLEMLKMLEMLLTILNTLKIFEGPILLLILFPIIGLIIITQKLSRLKWSRKPPKCVLCSPEVEFSFYSDKLALYKPIRP